MVINNPRPDANGVALNNKKLNEFQWSAEAARNFLVDSNGTNIDSSNPLPTTQQLKLDTVIEDNAFDLQASAYSSVVTPSYDYIIDNVQFDFSTNESRDITISSANGTKIYESLANTNLSVAVASINFGQSSGDSFTVAITQTSGSCNVDVSAVIKNSPVALTADPVIASGTNTIGSVRRADDFNLEVSKGAITGNTYIHKFGYAPDFDTADGVVTLWDGADDANINAMTYTYSTTADIDSLSSSDAGDTQNINVQGLDTNGLLVEQTITLSGQTRVSLTTSLKRVFRLKNLGSTNNTGHVYCYVNTAISAGVPTDNTTVRAVIQPGYNQTLMALVTVPSGKKGYLRTWFASTAGATKTADYVIELRARVDGGVFQIKHISSLLETGSSNIVYQYIEPELFAGMTDIEMRCFANASPAAVGAAVSAGFDMVWVDD